MGKYSDNNIPVPMAQEYDAITTLLLVCVTDTKPPKKKLKVRFSLTSEFYKPTF